MLNIRETGSLTIADQIKALSLPANRRARFHRQVGREVIKSARQRIQQQKTISGQRFEPRANNKKGKVLKRIARGKNLKAFTGANKATITWPNSLTGKIARAQQEGYTERFTPQKAKRRNGEPNYEGPATQEQAKALIKEGFKLNRGKYKSGKNKGKSKNRRVSQAWIRENMTLGQAGLVLRLLRDKRAAQYWETKVPPRPFFGLNQEERKILANNLLDEITEQSIFS